MPNASTHDAITLVTAAGANAAYFAFAPAPQISLAALFTGSYVLAGFACSGDLDLDSKQYRRWGPFRFLWWPYKKLVPHRHWLSHGYVAGGVIRLLYLGGMITLFTWVGVWLYSRLGPHADPNAITRAGWDSALQSARVYPHQTAALIAGFILAGTAHTLADVVSTGFKRRF